MNAILPNCLRVLQLVSHRIVDLFMSELMDQRKLTKGIMRPSNCTKKTQNMCYNSGHNHSTPSNPEDQTGLILSTKLQILFGSHQFLHVVFFFFFGVISL